MGTDCADTVIPPVIGWGFGVGLTLVVNAAQVRDLPRLVESQATSDIVRSKPPLRSGRLSGFAGTGLRDDVPAALGEGPLELLPCGRQHGDTTQTHPGSG
ncbi:hypothetical protein Kisp02_57740 [Kineosporia sp. NBRC 101731]|nr:hypothetical protein Kisp02_57740 [Kineosporia sp. NBRC 101731]